MLQLNAPFMTGPGDLYLMRFQMLCIILTDMNL